MKFSEFNSIIQGVDKESYKLLSSALEEQMEHLRNVDPKSCDIRQEIQNAIGSIYAGHRRYVSNMLASVLVQCGLVEIDDLEVVDSGNKAAQ